MIEHPTVRAVARFLPGIVAASLAIVYVIGSINAAGSFARDSLPVTLVRLLSLEQILVRGVSVLTQPELLFGTAIVVPFMYFASRLSGHVVQRVVDHTPDHRVSHVGAILFAVWLLGGLIGLLLAPWRVAATFAVMLGVFAALAGLILRADPDIRKRRFAVVIALVTVIGYAVANYFVGFPQPLAHIGLRDGQSLDGVFVTYANDVWYVAVEGDGDNEIQAIPSSEVKGARLRYRTTEPSPSVFSLIVDGFP